MIQNNTVYYAIAQYPTPVFNTPEITSYFGGKEGDVLHLDEQNLMPAVETVLFPGARVQLLELVKQPYIWKIKTSEYPYPIDLFIDERFVAREETTPIERQAALPPPERILETMNQLENTRYIWGGNWPQGIDLLPKFYPSKRKLNRLKPLIKDTWHLRGVDCSGLLHYATNGWTPRNTSSLVHFGKPVDIEGMTASEILKQVQPLDIIVWPGHVVCILNPTTTIESKRPEGVIKCDAHLRLSEIMKEKKPVNQWEASHGPSFVIRRWHPDHQNKRSQQTLH